MLHKRKFVLHQIQHKDNTEGKQSYLIATRQREIWILGNIEFKTKHRSRLNTLYAWYVLISVIVQKEIGVWVQKAWVYKVTHFELKFSFIWLLYVQLLRLYFVLYFEQEFLGQTKF